MHWNATGFLNVKYLCLCSWRKSFQFVTLSMRGVVCLSYGIDYPEEFPSVPWTVEYFFIMKNVEFCQMLLLIS